MTSVLQVGNTVSGIAVAVATNQPDRRIHAWTLHVINVQSSLLFSLSRLLLMCPLVVYCALACDPIHVHLGGGLGRAGKVFAPQRIRANCCFSILIVPLQVCSQHQRSCVHSLYISKARVCQDQHFTMASATTESHPRSRPQLSPLRLGSISELPENQHSRRMDLGAETPSSILKPSLAPSSMLVDEWANSGLAVNTNVPARRRSWRSNSWSSCNRSKGMVRFQKEKLDTDCGVWSASLIRSALVLHRSTRYSFEPAKNPRKVLCCGQCFCFDHLTDVRSSHRQGHPVLTPSPISSGYPRTKIVPHATPNVLLRPHLRNPPAVRLLLHPKALPLLPRHRSDLSQRLRHPRPGSASRVIEYNPPLLSSANRYPVLFLLYRQ